MNHHGSADCQFDEKTMTIHCTGEWSMHNASHIREKLYQISIPTDAAIKINGKKLTYFDAACALIIIEYQNLLTNKHKVDLTYFKKNDLALIQLIEQQAPLSPPVSTHKNNPFLETVGRQFIRKLHQIAGISELLGELFLTFLLSFRKLKRFQVPSILANIDNAGIKALPILALLSCLIGIVLAYQMGIQLQTYGANIFIAYLSGLAIFREFASLITAIIVAGRTASAFTAQIGSMRVNEEIDALLTMGISPVQRLVLPKILALLIIFPLLIFWADIFSVLGAMIMSKFMLDVSYYDFLMRLRESVGLKHFMLGIYKAPAFAMVIGLVGCFQGFQVEANTDSIGSQTTKSVVQSLFLIIVVDAWFSIIYSWLGL